MAEGAHKNATGRRAAGTATDPGRTSLRELLLPLDAMLTIKLLDHEMTVGTLWELIEKIPEINIPVAWVITSSGMAVSRDDSEHPKGDAFLTIAWQQDPEEGEY